MKDKINEKLKSGNFDKMELAEILWPESSKQSRRVMINRIIANGVKSLRHEQWVAVIKFFTAR